MTDQTDDVGRSRYFQLQRLARQQQRDTQELLTLYALEGLLVRLAASGHRDQLVVKGGMLLAAFGQRRPTRDLDVHAQQFAGDLDTVRGLVAGIAAVPIDDGLSFDAAGSTAQVIRDEDEYSGVRVTLDATLHTARLKVSVDVNVGDPIWPAPLDVAFPRLLDDEPLVLRGYPLHMVLAEKLVTAVDRGTASTRWRDFADLYLLTRQHIVDGPDIQQAVVRVADHRAVELIALDRVLEGMADLGQAKWVAWRAKQDLTDRLPEAFIEVVEAVVVFGRPVIAGEVGDATWQPGSASWEPKAS